MGRFVCAETPGNADVLQLRDRPTPTPGAGEIVISQTKIGLNFLDVYQTSGLYPFPENDVFVPGNEAAGRIISVGEGVSHLSVGDRVGYPMHVGAFAEERVIPADRVVKLPDDISDDMAAASMLKGMTVEYLLNQSVPLQSGDTVLFHAAAGGVGLLAGQWMKAMGVEAIGTAGSPEKVEMAKQAGYAHVINYTDTDFVDAVMDITSGKGVRAVYDSVGKDTYPGSLKVIQNCGYFISFGQSSGLATDFKLGDLAANGSLYAQRPTLATYIATADQLAESADNLFEMLRSGKVSVSVNQRFDLAEAADAFRALTGRKTTGVTLLETGL
ncbi:Zn-dependent oxidoreductase, NADPH:quinone reductase [SAR116 cluster alpha proteobacterium HIMB100]|nr:Zn-dependent oxidoreductase, NADPH:quinone reductase [SAR116 cluster alpha proteobacterium HIMB100]